MSIARVAAAVLILSATAAETISIRLDGGVFKVLGWQAPETAPAGGWPAILAVYAGTGDVPPVLGSYAVDGGSLVFRPRFPLSPGVHCRAVFRPPGGAPIEAVFDIPKAARPASTRVEHVYPTTDLLPGNQLKLYVQFSAPMGRGDAWRRIRLVDQAGAQVDLPFLEVDQELWDREYQRLTVLFDPGRIKRGLTPNQEVGPPIQEGKRYTLIIDQDWLDARGAPLQEGFRKAFRVGPADRTPPDPKQWRLNVPRAGTTDALAVEFPKPMDSALLTRSLQVAGAGGDVGGTIEIDREETRWRLLPRQAWLAGDYRLVVDTALEDLAGNRIGRPFDVDVFERVSEHLSRKTIELPFRVREQ